MSSQKPTILLVAGAFHPAELYSPSTTLLRETGYEVVALTLPGCGANPPLETAEPEIRAVREAALSVIEQGKDLVVVLHSWSGVPGSEAMPGLSKKERETNGLPGGVVYMVYFTAAIVDVGEGRTDESPWMSVKTDGQVYPIDPANIFYHDIPTSVSSQIVPQLQSHSWGPFVHKGTYTPWRKIPCTYVICENDQCIPAEYQRMFATKPGSLFEIVSLPSSHTPFVSMPAETVGIINKAARKHLNDQKVGERTQPVASQKESENLIGGSRKPPRFYAAPPNGPLNMPAVRERRRSSDAEGEGHGEIGKMAKGLINKCKEHEDKKKKEKKWSKFEGEHGQEKEEGKEEGKQRSSSDREKVDDGGVE